ncbi:S-adenosyl-L-methionine-dependent methyltransferase [Aspergillus filifer]
MASADRIEPEHQESFIEPDNGRRYHSYHEGEYVLSHHIYRMLLKGELHRAPIKNPARVLDIGTGTGIWAIDFADPIQPSWIPPNCRFEVDDFEQTWPYSQPFDYIHGRELEGFIRDHDHVFREAFKSLKPGGYFEISSIDVNSYSDDDTHLRAKCMAEGVKNMHAASKMFGKDMNTTSTWKGRMERAGFVNVTDEVFKLPQSPWAKDPKLKELGKYHQVNMFEAIPPYCYALFTRVLGWERAEIETLCAGIRAELKDLSIHLYSEVHIVYGQKPETAES